MKQIFTLLSAVLISYCPVAQVSVVRSGSIAFTSPQGSGQTWSSTNVLNSNNQYAASAAGSLIGGGTTITDYIVVKGFGFTVPINATINAIQVRIEKKRFAGNVYDHTVQLLKAGTATGNNKAATATNWPVADAYTAYGNTTNDLWGLTLSPFDVNSPNFGVRVSATLNNPSILLGAAGADIDHIEVTVTYTLITTDKDGDGVADAIDLDADNDGIATDREVRPCTAVSNFNFTSEADGTDPAAVDVTVAGLSVNIVRGGGITPTTYQVNNAYSATTEKEVQIIQTGSTPGNKTYITLNFSKPIANPSITLQDIDISAGQFIDNVRILPYYLNNLHIFTAAEVTTGATNTFIGNNTVQGSGASAPDATANGQVTFNLKTITDKIVIEYWNSDAAAGNQGVGIGGIGFCDATTIDTDADGIANYLDGDADNDGIPDLYEAGGVDINGDGRIDAFADANGNGLINAYDAASGGTALGALDIDGDGIPNTVDSDSDGDGVPDILEAGGIDTDNNGRLDNTADTDGDGLADIVDPDIGNDGTLENPARALLVTGADGNSDGAPDSYVVGNTDRMARPDVYDMDADGDGLPDALEAGITDADRNGLADGADANGDGWSDVVDALASLAPRNTDGRGKPDYQDIDADDDGITDNIEAWATLSYASPDATDADNDGLVDNYDNNDALFAGGANNGILPVDTDSDGIPDYRDTDSDNDNTSDRTEGHDINGNGRADDIVFSATDTDGDGLVDVFDLNNSLPVVIQNGMLNGGSVGNPAGAGAIGPLQKTTAGQPDRDWRTAAFVLPLQLIAFTANTATNHIRLNWQTQNEQNVLHIIVEKSTDGIHFNSIGQLPAYNTTAASYQFNDASPAADNYYRLKIVDHDGSYQTSQVIYIHLHMTAQTPRLYPNPLKDLLFIETPANCLHHSMEITFINTAGQAVRSFRLLPTRPVSTLHIGWLQPGSYLLQVIVPSKNIKLSQQVTAQ